MELVGPEKRIQELFRELRLEDERLTPRYAAVWNRAQAESTRPRRAFKLSFAVTAVLLVVTLFSLAWWSRRGPQGQQTVAVAPTTPIVNPEPTVVDVGSQPDAAVGPRHLVSSKRRNLKLAARRQAELIARNAAIREAAAISSWKSPTVTLLQSPADEVLTSVPQLSQPVNELKSFLPNTPK